LRKRETAGASMGDSSGAEFNAVGPRNFEDPNFEFRIEKTGDRRRGHSGILHSQFEIRIFEIPWAGPQTPFTPTAT
jgi:hypothetical protein